MKFLGKYFDLKLILYRVSRKKVFIYMYLIWMDINIDLRKAKRKEKK